jgi:hypothetical protein
MAYKYKLREEEAETTPSNREQVNYDIVVTPNSVSVEDTVKALETLDNYGMYVSNMRNKSSIQKAIEDHFGPVIPAKRKKMERDQGFPFPVKTKTSIDDFVKSHTSKPTLLKYKVKDDTIVFPKSGNPSKNLTKKMIDVVMKNAKIDYSVADKEAVDEAMVNKENLKITSRKDKNDPNVFLINIEYPAGPGFSTALGSKTMSGQESEKGAKLALEKGNKIVDKLSTKYNIEDHDINDLKNGTVQVYIRSNDFAKMSSPSIDETKNDEIDPDSEEAKVYFMQQFKLGNIEKIPDNPKAEYMKIKMTKEELKEVIREQIKNLIK